MKNSLHILIALACLIVGTAEAQQLYFKPKKPEPAGSSYTAQTASFDGANDRIQFSGSAVSFSGAGKVATVAGWVDPSADGTAQMILQGRNGTSGSQYYVLRTSGNALRFVFQNSTPTTIVDVQTANNTAEAADGRIHFYFTFNTDSGTLNWDLWINGVDVSGSSTQNAFVTDGVWAGDRTHLNIGADDSNGSDHNGLVAELWLDDSYNVGNSTNVGKFYNGGNPVDLGSDGSTPFGSAPDFYMKFTPGSLGVNSGADGGTGTVAGDVTNGATFP